MYPLLISTPCFIAFYKLNIHKFHARKALQFENYVVESVYADQLPITNTSTCVWSSQYMTRFVVRLSPVMNTLLHGFDLFMIYMDCECSMFLGARTHRNAMERSIHGALDLSFIENERKDIHYHFPKSVTLRVSEQAKCFTDRFLNR